MAKNNKAFNLLKVLGQRTPSTEPAAKPIVVPSAPSKRDDRPTQAKRPSAKPAPPKGGHGKAIQFYLHEADERLIREFAVWLSPHRKSINDSLIVKAVLRAAKTGPELLAGYDAGLAVSKAHQKGRYPQSAEPQ